MASFLSLVKKTSGSEAEILKVISELARDENWVEVTSRKELQQIATFLCQMQHTSALKILLLLCFKQLEKMPGDALFYFITANSKINIAQSFFSILDSEFAFFKTYLCPFNLAPEMYDEQVTKQYNVYLKKFNRTKEDLIDKLQFARTQRLEAEVKKTLEKLIEAFPQDPSFVKEKGQYFEKEAGNVIDKGMKAFADLKKQDLKAEHHTPLFNADEVYQAIKNDFNEENLNYLLEIFLVSGEDETAIQIMNEHIFLKKIYFWNFIELSVVKQRYLEALALIKDMKELKTTEDEFNYYYFTAICLWHLNDKQTALDTMRSIARVKPHFKQTQIYLNLWQHHDEVA